MAEGTNIGKAFVQVMPSMDGFSDELRSQGESAGEEAGKKAGGRLGAAIKAAVIAAGIGAVIKAAVLEGGELEQAIGGIETLYKDSADTMRQYADQAYMTAGISASAYMSQVTSFSAGLIASMGGDTQAAAEIANMSMMDMSDNANKMGTSMEDIQNAYQGFARQNYMMLDSLKLGYSGTKTEMERLLADAQALTGVEYDINNLADVYSAIHVIQNELGITGTTAKEATTTLSGSLGQLKAAAQNLLGNLALGESIVPSLQALGETVKTFIVNNLVPMVGNVLLGLPQIIGSALDLGGALIGELTQSADDIAQGAAQLVTDLVGGIVTALPSLVQGIGDFLLAIVPALLAELPTLITSVLDAVMTALPLLIDTITQLVLGVVAALPTIITTLLDALPGIIDAIIDSIVTATPLLLDAAITLLMAIVDAIPQIVEALVEALPTIIDTVITGILDAIPQLLEGAITFLMAIIDALPAIIQMLVQELPKIVTTIVNTLLDHLPELIDGAVQLFFGILEAIPQIIVELAMNMPQIVATIVQGLVQGIGQVAQVGLQLVQGLWRGISNATSWVLSKIRGFGQSILNGIKGIFGIHSPSREMAWMGQMLDAGLASGISDGTKPISDAIDEVTAMTTRGFSNQLAVNAALGVSADADATGLLQRLIASVDTINARLDGMQVVLDSGQLVGGIARKMDAALGTRGNLTARGVTV